MDDEEGSGWTIVKKCSKLNLKKITVPNYVQISNRYATLPAFSAPPDSIQRPKTTSSPQTQYQSHYRLKIERRRKAKLAQQIKQLCENEFLDKQIGPFWPRVTMQVRSVWRSTRRIPLLHQPLSLFCSEESTRDTISAPNFAEPFAIKKITINLEFDLPASPI